MYIDYVFLIAPYLSKVRSQSQLFFPFVCILINMDYIEALLYFTIFFSLLEYDQYLIIFFTV